MDGWRQRDNIPHRRKEAGDCVATFDKTFSTLRDFHACLIGVNKDKKDVQKKEKRHGRYVLSKRVELYVSEGCPANLAKIIGTFDFGRLALTAEVATSPDHEPLFKNTASYSQPTFQMFSATNGAASEDLFYVGATIVSENMSELQEVRKSAATAIIASGDEQSSDPLTRAICGVNMTKFAVDLTVVEACLGSKPPISSLPMLHVLPDMTFDCNYDTCYLPGIATLITVSARAV